MEATKSVQHVNNKSISLAQTRSSRILKKVIIMLQVLRDMQNTSKLNLQIISYVLLCLRWNHGIINTQWVLLKQIVTIRPDFLWPPATSKYGDLRSRIGVLWLQECCGLRPQPTVAVSGRESLRSSQQATQKKWSAYTKVCLSLIKWSPKV